MAGAVASAAVAGVGGASRRWQRPFSRSGLGLGMLVGNWLRGEPRYSSPGPPPPIYTAVRRGPTNHIGLGAPDQGARTRPKRPLGLMEGDHF
jgi:hypothetical protein